MADTVEVKRDSGDHWTVQVMHSWLVDIPTWARIVLGILVASIIILMFSGTMSAVNRVVDAWALGIEREVDNRKFDTTLAKMLESVSRLEIVAKQLEEAQQKLDRIDTRLLAMGNDIHNLDKRLYYIELRHQVVKPQAKKGH